MLAAAAAWRRTVPVEDHAAARQRVQERRGDLRRGIVHAPVRPAVVVRQQEQHVRPRRRRRGGGHSERRGERHGQRRTPHRAAAPPQSLLDLWHVHANGYRELLLRLRPPALRMWRYKGTWLKLVRVSRSQLTDLESEISSPLFSSGLARGARGVLPSMHTPVLPSRRGCARLTEKGGRWRRCATGCSPVAEQLLSNRLEKGRVRLGWSRWTPRSTESWRCRRRGS